jgi:hypothetical protein
MDTVPEPSVAAGLGRDAGPSLSRTPSKWRTIAIGLAVRFAGLVFIWLGDGHTHLFHKALVVVGVVLSVGGIAVLRYLLITGLFKKT